MTHLLSRRYPAPKDAGGGDRTRTCTGFHLNGFLDRGSTNYAYSSILVERGIFIESSKTRWCASPRYRTSFWEVSCETYWCPQTLGFKCLLVVSRVSLLRHITTKSYSIFIIPLRDAPDELLRRPGYLLWHMTSILVWYLYLHYTSLNRLYFSVFGGEGGIRTLAPVPRPTVLAGPPLIATWVPRQFNISRRAVLPIFKATHRQGWLT